jgi:CBS domain-containing protein
MSDHERVALAGVRDSTVAAAMLPRPKTLPADARVAEVRLLFTRSTMRTVLLVDGTAFRGAIERDDVPESAPDDARAIDYVGTFEAITPEAPIATALDRLAQRDEQRLVVLDADGTTLRGLLCLTGGGSAFCVGP